MTMWGDTDRDWRHNGWPRWHEGQPRNLGRPMRSQPDVPTGVIRSQPDVPTGAIPERETEEARPVPPSTAPATPPGTPSANPTGLSVLAADGGAIPDGGGDVQQGAGGLIDKALEAVHQAWQYGLQKYGILKQGVNEGFEKDNQDFQDAVEGPQNTRDEQMQGQLSPDDPRSQDVLGDQATGDKMPVIPPNDLMKRNIQKAGDVPVGASADPKLEQDI